MSSKVVESRADVRDMDTLRVQITGAGTNEDGNPVAVAYDIEATEAVIVVQFPSTELAAGELEPGQEERTTHIMTIGDLCMNAGMIGDAIVNLCRRTGWQNYPHIMEHIADEIATAVQEDAVRRVGEELN